VLGHGAPRNGCGLESPGSHSRAQEEALDLALAENRGRVRRHVAQAGPLAHQARLAHQRQEHQSARRALGDEVEARSTRIRVVRQDFSARQQFTALGLRDIEHCVERTHQAADHRLDGLGDERLEGMGHDRKLQARHRGNFAAPAGHRGEHGSGGDWTAVRDDAPTGAAVGFDPSHAGLLMDVDTQARCSGRITPHHGIVSHKRARWVIAGADDREFATAREIDVGADFQDLARGEHPRVHAHALVEQALVVLHPPRIVGVHEIDLTLVREHQVEIQFLGERAVHLQALFVERDGLRRVVVGADHLGVAARGSGPDVGALQNSDVFDSMVGSEVVRGREPLNATADDHDVVAWLHVAQRQEVASTQQARHAVSESSCTFRVRSASSISSCR